MTRMTSDIEALSQLFQDGLVNLLVQGLTLVVITARAVRARREARAHHAGLVVPPMFVLTLWFRARPTTATASCATASPTCSPTCPRAWPASAIIAAYNRRRHNVDPPPQHRRRAPRRQPRHRARRRDLRARHRGHRRRRPVAMLLVGGKMVLRRRAHARRADRVHPVPDGVLRADPAARAALHTYQQGQAAVQQAARAARHRPERRAEAGTPSSCRRSTGEIVLDTCASATTPSAPVLRRRQPAHRRRREPRARRPDRRRQVDDRQAGHPLLRPARAARCCIDGHDLRDVTFDSLRRQLGVVPQEPFLFHGTIRDNVAFAPARRHRRRGRSRRATPSASTMSSTACPRGSTRRCTSAARRCRPASASCSRSPARSWPGRGCWCSTRRRRTSTCGPRQDRAGARHAARGPHRDHHRPPPRDRHARRSHRGRRGRRASSSSARTTSSSSRGGRYAAMYATWTRGAAANSGHAAE